MPLPALTKKREREEKINEKATHITQRGNNSGSILNRKTCPEKFLFSPLPLPSRTIFETAKQYKKAQQQQISTDLNL